MKVVRQRDDSAHGSIQQRAMKKKRAFNESKRPPKPPQRLRPSNTLYFQSNPNPSAGLHQLQSGWCCTWWGWAWGTRRTSRCGGSRPCIAASWSSSRPTPRCWPRPRSGWRRPTARPSRWRTVTWWRARRSASTCRPGRRTWRSSWWATRSAPPRTPTSSCAPRRWVSQPANRSIRPVRSVDQSHDVIPFLIRTL